MLCLLLFPEDPLEPVPIPLRCSMLWLFVWLFRDVVAPVRMQIPCLLFDDDDSSVWMPCLLSHLDLSFFAVVVASFVVVVVMVVVFSSGYDHPRSPF